MLPSKRPLPFERLEQRGHSGPEFHEGLHQVARGRVLGIQTDQILKEKDQVRE